MSPRPRRWLEAGPEAMAALYADGMSSRELQDHFGVSRWVVDRLLREAGVAMRSQREASGLQRMLADLRDEASTDARCRWPECSQLSPGGALCARHVDLLAEHEGRDCAWPRCCERVLWDAAAGRWAALCYAHAAKAEGRL